MGHTEWSNRVDERARDIFARISRVLGDWPTADVEALATQMAELELRGEQRAANESDDLGAARRRPR